jgi:two-component system response regulator HydG
MAPGLQAKLLRAIESGEIRAVGSDTPRHVDVRIIAATHQELEQRVREGSFRADLFYRLNVVPLQVPPLRARAEDIPLLVERFLENALRHYPACPARRFTQALMAELTRCPWPGNVRELENIVTRLVIVSAGEVVDVADLRACAPAMPAEPPPLLEAKERLVPLRQLESEYINWVVEQCGGNKTRAAQILKIDVSTIHRRDRQGA